MLRSWASLCLDTETDRDGNLLMLQLGNHEVQYVIDAREGGINDVLNLLSKKEIIAHNIKFDYTILKNNGVVLDKVWDTMLAAQILECGKPSPKGQFTLESVTRRYVDEFAYSDQLYIDRPVVNKKIRETFASTFGEFTQEQLYYGALDVYYTYRVYLTLKERIHTENMDDLMVLENAFALVLADMTDNGIKLDTTMWLELAERAQERTSTLRWELDTIAQKEVNWNSPKQVLEILKSRGISPKVIDKETGALKDSVAKTVLTDITDELVLKYLEYREQAKKA